MKKVDDSDSEDEIVQVKDPNKKKKKKKKAKSEQPVISNPMAKLALQRLQQKAEEEAKLKALQEEEDRKIKEEEDRLAAIEKAAEEEKERKKKLKQDKILAQKQAGTYMTKSQKEKAKINKMKLENLLAQSKIVHKAVSSSSETKEKDSVVEATEKDKFRAPIIAIMGHVDTGKTKILDKIRQSNVQDGEAGGITQQIGASFLPKDTLAKKYNNFIDSMHPPGLLVIDTPGHEAFKNLRTKGASICDIAIVVIDITHGLEPQTIQSIEILKDSDTPFVFALNKIDRLYGWVSTKDVPINEAIYNQKNVINEFETNLRKVQTQIMELGLNSKVYWEIDEEIDYIPIIPTSAVTDEGISDLLNVVINYCQNNICITKSSTLSGTVLDVVYTEKFGNTVDIILKNGELKVGDTIYIGTVSTTIKHILTPPPNKESRVTTEYIHHKSIQGAVGVKLVGSDLSKVIIGNSISFDLGEINCENKSNVELDPEGVIVHANSQGSLEALVHFLRNECNPKIPVSNISIGNITKMDIMKASLIKGLPEYKTFLSFNVKTEEEAVISAKENKIKIITAEIIYHLFDQYKIYSEELRNYRKEAAKIDVVFPCILKILPEHIYNKKNPLIFGVDVLEGDLVMNTPLATSTLTIGKVISIQHNGKDIEVAKKGTSVCIKVDNQETPTITYGRQFTHTDPLYSRITRKSIDVLKEHFREDITKEKGMLLIKLKKIFSIV